ncbi:hypothetical protein SAMN05421824_2103 [Hyunsoonleella jejuensis]|uniref:Prenyltransferase n=1 Tax=Hyunsoonleella jejuensis TaxID=419940 RepID=A0A1H9I8Y8_9FLAO|nr:hypothetical protein [Hyunsoonleella jejuensis]SEQ71010.1 hypothetical protein SAMN05421824_2103 [Hyunsoonleella jejuensis]
MYFYKVKVFKQIFNFYINASIHVALAVYALTYVTLLEFGIPYDEPVLYFVFYATITGYNFVKFFGLAKFYHRSLAGWLKAIQVFSLLCFVLMCYYVVQLPSKILIYVAFFGIITFFYAIPFLPKRIFIDKHHNLRSISGLKVYVIALVWTGVTVFLPVLSNDLPINTDIIITGIQRFLYVIILMLPFEIRDLKFDNLRLSTIPQSIGVRATKIMGIVLAITIFLMEFFKDDLSKKYILPLALTLTLTVILVLYSKVNQGKYYSAFWVEGLPITWLLAVLFFS